MERALEGIESQLRSDEVDLVMECLRNAKRFHATVSFIADTGLKDATDIGEWLNDSSRINVDSPCSAQIQPAHEGFPAKRTSFST